jgi:hypothetical protein
MKFKKEVKYKKHKKFILPKCDSKEAKNAKLEIIRNSRHAKIPSQITNNPTPYQPPNLSEVQTRKAPITTTFPKPSQMSISKTSKFFSHLAAVNCFAFTR